jgi:hypothetical protein
MSTIDSTCLIRFTENREVDIVKALKGPGGKLISVSKLLKCISEQAG